MGGPRRQRQGRLVQVPPRDGRGLPVRHGGGAAQPRRRRRRRAAAPGDRSWGRSISGRSQGGAPEHRFDTGSFKDLPVYLGEVRTDAAGRLLFLGGRGVSRSPGGALPYVPTDEDAFGNAADWHDDIADGPVDAVVRIDGRNVPTKGAWVASAPPNYAPDIRSWRTLYDLLVDLYVREKLIPPKQAVSFTQDIYPILARLSGLQWVNKAFAALFGHNAPFNFADPVLIDRISRIHGGGQDVFKPLRLAIFNLFREQTAHPSDPAALPWLYGDGFGSAQLPSDPHQNLPLDGERLRYLQSWRDGLFAADWGMQPSPQSIDLVPVSKQPAALDRAALDFCAADAFHPGIELTWPMRRISIYDEPFRIARAKGPEPDYGPHLDVATALSDIGPLHGQFPGSLSRWMLLPWQIDTGGCLAGYDTRLAADAPSFWPARVPNNVLSQANYARATDASLNLDDRVNAFVERRSWFAPLNSEASGWGERLIDEFGQMGVVEAYPGVSGDPNFPPVIYAETLPAAALPASSSAGMQLGKDSAAVSAEDAQARAAGFSSEADRMAMRRMRFGR